jgi:hypothetical protein
MNTKIEKLSFAGSGDSIHLAPDLGDGLIPSPTAPI